MADAQRDLVKVCIAFATLTHALAALVVFPEAALCIRGLVLDFPDPGVAGSGQSASNSWGLEFQQWLGLAS